MRRPSEKPSAAPSPPRRRRWLKRLLLAGPWALAALVLSAWVALHWVPLPAGLRREPDPAVEYIDRHGRPLRAVPGGGGPYRQYISYGEIPLPLVHATLAAEDARFWSHPGVDARAVLRAAAQWLRHRRVVSGGSTVTQQLVKLAEPRPRTLAAKIAEAAQALRLEQVWSKQRILEEYLNRLDYGNFNIGCAAAARFYFDKPPGDLSPAECAFLAGLPQGPTRLNPLRHFDRAKKRQEWILDRMRERGWLSAEEHARAKAEPLRLADPRRAFHAPHFVDLLLARDGPPPGARRVRTTLDLDLNRFAETALRLQLGRLAPRQARNGAVVILDNRSAEVLALVGSEDYFAPAAGQVNGAWAPRSAGSAFKPFTYLLALEAGGTAATIVADVPAEFPTPTGLFRPVNYDRHCRGPVRYRPALANSLNIPAVKVLERAGGPGALLGVLRACGLTTLAGPPERYGLGLTIGNAEARLLELANAYAALARLGEFRDYALTLAPGGAPAPSGRRVAGSAAAYIIADILADNEARAAAFGADSPLRFEFPVACKTGTSSGFRDNWAFGYTPEFTVGVWVGNFDGAPMRDVSGVTGAGPVLHDVFEYLRARHGTSWYAAPADVVHAWIDPLTGKRVADDARPPESAARPEPVREIFLRSALPPAAGPDDYTPAGRVRLGPEYRDWLAGPDNWLRDRAVAEAAAEALEEPRIRFPLPGTIIYLDPDLPEGGRRLWLQGDNGGPGDLVWACDSLECRREGGRTVALLQEGRHTLVLKNTRRGLSATTWIVVRR